MKKQWLCHTSQTHTKYIDNIRCYILAAALYGKLLSDLTWKVVYKMSEGTFDQLAEMKQVPRALKYKCVEQHLPGMLSALHGKDKYAVQQMKAIKGEPVAVLPPQLLVCSPHQSSLRLAESVGVWACTQQPKVLDAN